MTERDGPVVDPPRFLADGWTPVTGGVSGARVYRSADGHRYAKWVPARDVDALRAERDRAAWLATTGVPGPDVLDWYADDTGACLVTSAVPGVPADRLTAPRLRAAWAGIADLVRRLHDLPVAGCPFDRGLTWMVTVARDVVTRGAVNPAFLPVDERQIPPADLLARLSREIAGRRAQEASTAVVCHGDLCLPNIIVDPGTLRVTGLIDLGRLGRADPYIDIALLLATARETWPDAEQARAEEERFAGEYGIRLDPDRLRFYLRLDPLTWG